MKWTLSTGDNERTEMIKKRFFKTKDEVDVTFRTSLGQDVEGVSMVCDAHDWQPIQMKSSGKRNWQLRTRMPVDQVVQFRYLASGGLWFNDDGADEYVPNAFGGDNSVVNTTNLAQRT